jgi:hypothetical protein
VTTIGFAKNTTDFPVTTTCFAKNTTDFPVTTTGFPKTTTGFAKNTTDFPITTIGSAENTTGCCNSVRGIDESFRVFRDDDGCYERRVAAGAVGGPCRLPSRVTGLRRGLGRDWMAEGIGAASGS